MCGIAGVFRSRGGISDSDVRAVTRASEAQSHRGPDDFGLFHDGRAVLGHRRLSIIDLSPAGHQPMQNEDGTVQVVYNGEIYNFAELHRELESRGHRFGSVSDTETLLHGYEEWGMEGLLKRLRGMFAFALYDSGRGLCYLARDRFGIKPLYYAETHDSLAFASEVKALVRSGLTTGESDRDGIIGFLLFGSVPAPATSVKGVRCLLPGHYLVAAKTNSLHRYWDPRNSPATGDCSLGQTLQDSVARHLVSDVPVGVFLSGGVDSVGMVALAARSRARLATLTVVFDEKEFDEAALARRAAQRFQTDHREVRVTSADFLQVFPAILSAMDQPTNDGVNTYFVSRAARQAGLTVVLSGLGGDEVFWGYKHYRWLSDYKESLRRLGSVPASVRNSVLNLAMWYGKARGHEKWMRLAALRNGMSSEALYLAIRGFFAPPQILRLLDIDSRELGMVLEKQMALHSAEPEGGHAAAFNRLEIARYLHDQLLRDTDVFSMAHSIEVRVPYLDNAVTDLAFGLPSERQRPAFVNKPALVNAISDDLVNELARLPKQGFAFPFAAWMRKNAGCLEEEATSRAHLLQPAAVRKLWRAFAAGRLHWSRAWATVVLGMAESRT